MVILYVMVAAAAVEVAVDVGGAIGLSTRRELAMRRDESRSVCTTVNRDGFQRVGCGACVDDCYGGTSNGPQLTAHSSQKVVTQESQCFQQCEADPACKSLSLDWGSKTCSLHTALPLGSACSGASKCDPEHQEAKSSCQAEACYLKVSDYSVAAQVRSIGAGVCSRKPSFRDGSRAGATMEAVLVDGQSVGTTAPVVTTSQSAFDAACTSSCESNNDCRSATMGLRQKCTATGCEDVEYFCELEKTTASQASTANFTKRAEGCKKYCQNDDGLALLMTCAECYVKTVTCKVKSVRSAQEMVFRGEGLCQDGTTAEADQLMNLTFSSARECQSECEQDSQCTGSAYAMGSDTAQQFCRHYRGTVQQASEVLNTVGCSACQASASACSCGSKRQGWFGGTASSPLCCDACISCQQGMNAKCFAKDYA